MAIKKPTTKPGALATTELRLVTFVEASVIETSNIEVNMDGFVEAPSTLAPTAQWSEVGEYVEGAYLGIQDEVGQYGSRLYSIQMPDRTVVAVWGGAVLDNRMDVCIAMGLKPGDTLRVVYSGNTEAKKGQNPARLFKVGFKK